MENTITGQEVVAIPGQSLDPRELRYMVGLADGESNAQIAQACGVCIEELPLVEVNIRGKLGARTKTHMLARAFTLGILRSRALVVIFVLVTVVGTTSVVCFKKMSIPHINGDGKAIDYDIMAGGSNGPAVQDPRFINFVSRRHHPS
jgi:hypothetical protein